MQLDQMIALASSVGVELRRDGEHDRDGLPHLYVHVADRGAGAVVYVGKQESAARTRNESVWGRRSADRSSDRFVAVGSTGRPMMVSAWTAMVEANDSVSVDLWLGAFDVHRARAAIGRAAEVLARANTEREREVVDRYAEFGVEDGRAAFERFLEYDFVTPRRGPAWFEHPDRVEGADIEKFLVRLAVRSGRPIANAQYAGQWESLLDTPADTLAAVAHLIAGPDRPA